MAINDGKSKQTYYYLEKDVKKAFYHTNQYNLILRPFATQIFWALWDHGKMYTKHADITEWFYCSDKQLMILTGIKSRATINCYKEVLSIAGLINKKTDLCKYHNKLEHEIIEINNNRKMNKRITFYRMVNPIPTLTVEGIKNIDISQNQMIKKWHKKQSAEEHNKDYYKEKDKKQESQRQTIPPNPENNGQNDGDMFPKGTKVCSAAEHNVDYQDSTEDKKIYPNNVGMDSLASNILKIGKTIEEPNDTRIRISRVDRYLTELKKQTTDEMKQLYKTQIENDILILEQNKTVNSDWVNQNKENLKLILQG